WPYWSQTSRTFSMLLSGRIATPFVIGAASAAENANIAPAPRARERTIFFMSQLLRLSRTNSANFRMFPLEPDVCRPDSVARRALLKATAPAEPRTEPSLRVSRPGGAERDEGR